MTLGDADIARLADEMRPFILEGALDDVVEGMGGAGLCEDVSHEIVGWLEMKGVRAEPVWFCLHARVRKHGESTAAFRHLPDEYPLAGALDQDHCVVIIEDTWLLDMTARQFCEDMPYPLILRANAGETR